MFNLRSTKLRPPAGRLSWLQRRTQRAFTLVEVMIATAVFTMGILGVYAMMIKSYELVTLARHRDNARAYLMSFSDQFLRLNTTDPNPTPGLPPILRPLFDTSSTHPGDGLVWTDANNIQSNGAGLPYLQVTLGEAGSSQISAKVRHYVTYLDSSGRATGTNTAAAAGWILQGTFTIDYQIAGHPQQEKIIVARSVR